MYRHVVYANVLKLLLFVHFYIYIYINRVGTFFSNVVTINVINNNNNILLFKLIINSTFLDHVIPESGIF